MGYIPFQHPPQKPSIVLYFLSLLSFGYKQFIYQKPQRPGSAQAKPPNRLRHQ